MCDFPFFWQKNHKLCHLPFWQKSDFSTIQSIFSLRLWITFVILKDRIKMRCASAAGSCLDVPNTKRETESCFFVWKFAEKNRPALAELGKEGLPLTTAAGFLSFFSAIPQFPLPFTESYPQAVDNPVYNFCELWIFCGWKKYGLQQNTEIPIFSGLCKTLGLFFHTAVYKKKNVLSIHREKTGDCGQMKKLSTASEHRIFEKER